MLLWLRWRLGERKPHLVKRLLKWLPQAYLSRMRRWNRRNGSKKKPNLQLSFLQHMHENRWRPFRCVRAHPALSLSRLDGKSDLQSSVWRPADVKTSKNVRRFVMKLKIHKEVGKYWGVDEFLCCFYVNFKNGQSKDTKYRLILWQGPVSAFLILMFILAKKETNGIVLEPCVFNEAGTLFRTC